MNVSFKNDQGKDCVSVTHNIFTVTLKVIETDDEYNLIEVISFHSLGGMQGIKGYLLTSITKVFNSKRNKRDPLVMAAGISMGSKHSIFGKRKAIVLIGRSSSRRSRLSRAHRKLGF